MLIELRLLERAGIFGLVVEGRVRVKTRLRDELDVDRLTLGDELRVRVRVGVLGRDPRTTVRLLCVRDRDGLLIRGVLCRLGATERRVGADRVGVDRRGVGRETDRERDRLVAERMLCRALERLLLLLLELLLLLREPRFEGWASAARAGNKTIATTRAAIGVL